MKMQTLEASIPIYIYCVGSSDRVISDKRLLYILYNKLQQKPNLNSQVKGFIYLSSPV